MRERTRIRVVIVLSLGLASWLADAQQIADPNFKAAVDHPAYTSKHPRVVIDEAHNNFHTADGRYKPLAELLRADGYEVVAGKKPFTEGIDAAVLLIANARSSGGNESAFTDQEAAAVRRWVEGGGALFLIADHTPFGAAARNLARQFGVELGNGFVFEFDESHIFNGGQTSMLFSEENKLLGDHAITRGRNAREKVRRVVAFTGESLSVPAGAQVLLRLGPDAMETPPRPSENEPSEVEKILGITFGDAAKPDAAKIAEAKKKFGVGGRAQGLAMTVGKGRVVITGEAAMFSAQVIRGTDNGGKATEFHMGMNVEGTDDRQFALNVLHWLTGVLR
jgi:hypothetical protein